MGVVTVLANNPDVAPAIIYFDAPTGVLISHRNLTFISSYIVNLSIALGILRRSVAKYPAYKPLIPYFGYISYWQSLCGQELEKE